MDEQVAEWVDDLVGVLTDYGKPMPLQEAASRTAKIADVSPVRMSFVVDVAIVHGKVQYNRRENTLELKQ